MKQAIDAPIANFTDLLLDAICMVDADGRFVFVSAACERIFGYRQEEMIGKLMFDLIAPDDRERTLQAAHTIMSGQPNTHFENRYIRKDGSIVHIRWSARWSEADQLRIAVAHDITASKQEEAMRAALYAISEAAHASDDLPTLLQQIHQIIGGLLPAPGMVVALQDEADQQLHFAYFADEGELAAQAPFARALCEEILRCSQPLRLSPGTEVALSEALQTAVGVTPDHWIGVPLNTQQGGIGVLALQRPADGIGYTQQHQDWLVFVSTQIATAVQRQRLHARLSFIAQHDELTRLPNRRLFQDRLQTAFARAQRQQARLSLLFIDLDKFKQVNDQYGHAAGDLLLQEVAHRVKNCVRESDTVARIGGDEFVVLVENVGAPENATLIEYKIHLALAAPVELGENRKLHITASIGVAHFPEDGSEIQQLIRHADQIMYAAKRSNANAMI